jgi:hypothetical protein
METYIGLGYNASFEAPKGTPMEAFRVEMRIIASVHSQVCGSNSRDMKESLEGWLCACAHARSIVEAHAV